MSNDFTVIKGEVDKVIDTLKEVSAWGRSIGLNVWKDEDLTKEKLLKYAKEEEFCLGKVSGDNACAMILQWKDSLFWPGAKDNEAGYIHKLCVRRQYAGQGLPGKLVGFALEECRKKKINYLRLDTGWTNKKLIEMYEGLGFEIVDKFPLGNGAFALMELKIK